MEVGAAGCSADWLADRWPQYQRMKENSFVGSSHKCLLHDLPSKTEAAEDFRPQLYKEIILSRLHATFW
jgi:hypothetical protein